MSSTDHLYSPHVGTVIGCLQVEGARTAVKYVDHDFVVKATRTYRGSLRRDSRNVSVLVTWGRPNYAERRFIERCKKAGEPFPVKKIQYKLYPERKTKK